MPATMLLTVEETAAQLRIARRRVFEMIRDGSLPSVKIGRSRRIRSADLAAYVANLEPDAQQAAADAGVSA
jgi:excisionase family DNA binding protein